MESEIPSIDTATFNSPNYLETDLIDDDVKAIFKDKNGSYFSSEVLLCQLIKQLKKLIKAEVNL